MGVVLRKLKSQEGVVMVAWKKGLDSIIAAVVGNVKYLRWVTCVLGVAVNTEPEGVGPHSGTM